MPPDLTIVKEVVPVNPIDVPITPVKRGRGRPKKTPVAVVLDKPIAIPTPVPVYIEETGACLLTPEPGTQPLKNIVSTIDGTPRKRGRPKKISTTLSVDLPLVVQEPPATPRRGRPPKKNVITPVIATPVLLKRAPTALKSAPVSVITTSAGSEYPCSMCPRVFSSEFVSFR